MRVEDRFYAVYTKFRMHFYREIFGHFASREATLTTVESFCMEVIYAMDHPTVNEFASFIRISQPNAAYKVNNLIKKGYLKKIRSEEDKREFHLEVTQKYKEYYNISNAYLHTVIGRLRDRFSEEDLEKLSEILKVLSEELMPEVPVYGRYTKALKDFGDADGNVAADTAVKAVAVAE
ncbi:MAG: MarR family winged helix-turn-helix transcriptional regulator [Lachnospiraceae bacterium]|nr:MarR family winged helix-turn-helix transcriptional regulator [Lachnospiraceae bacterium]